MTGESSRNGLSHISSCNMRNASGKYENRAGETPDGISENANRHRKHRWRFAMCSLRGGSNLQHRRCCRRTPSAGRPSARGPGTGSSAGNRVEKPSGLRKNSITFSRLRFHSCIYPFTQWFPSRASGTRKRRGVLACKIEFFALRWSYRSWSESWCSQLCSKTVFCDNEI